MAKQGTLQTHPLPLILHHRLWWAAFARARKQDAGIVGVISGLSWARHQQLSSAWAIEKQASELLDWLTTTCTVLVLQRWHQQAEQHHYGHNQRQEPTQEAPMRFWQGPVVNEKVHRSALLCLARRQTKAHPPMMQLDRERGNTFRKGWR